MKQAAFLLHIQPSTQQKLCSGYILRLHPTWYACVWHAHLMPHVTILNSHFLGRAKLWLQCSLLILQSMYKKKSKDKIL